MAGQSLEKLRAVNDQEWKLSSAKASAARRSLPATADTFLEKLVASGRLEVVDRADLQSQPRRGMPTTAQLEMKADPEAFYVLMVRHESGAISYHFPTQVERSTMRGVVTSSLRFSVPVPETIAPKEEQRGRSWE